MTSTTVQMATETTVVQVVDGEATVVQTGVPVTVTSSGSGAPTDASYLTLGTNATLTNERVLTAGSNITLTDGGAGSTLTIAATGGVDTEQVQDIVGAMVTAGSGITATYDDTAGTVTVTATGPASTEAVQDIVGALITSGTNVTATYDDAANTLTLSSTLVGSNTQTADYTLVLADAGKVVEMNASTATTLTIPPNSSVAFPTGTVIEVCQLGSGSVTVSAGSGVTIDGGNVTMTAQYGSCLLRKRGTDEWVVTLNAGSVVQVGELGTASLTTDFVQTGVGNSLVTGLSVTVTVGNRPVKVSFSGELKHSTSGSSAAITIEEDGTQIAEAGFVARGTNEACAIHRTVRRSPTAGTHTYRIRLYSNVSGDATCLGASNNAAVIMVEQV